MYQQHIVLDFEMNPVDKTNSEVWSRLRAEIIEIGAVRLNEHFEPVERFSCMLRPEYNCGIDIYISDLTGIKTPEAFAAASFAQAMADFSAWIGDRKTRICTWGEGDLEQFTAECAFKDFSVPENMRRWLDMQLIFPRIMQIKLHKRRLSLRDGAETLGIFVDGSKAHRALYDAEITSEVVSSILSGKYREQLELLRSAKGEESARMTCSLGDACGGALAAMLEKLSQEPKYVG